MVLSVGCLVTPTLMQGHRRPPQDTPRRASLIPDDVVTAANLRESGVVGLLYELFNQSRVASPHSVAVRSGSSLLTYAEVGALVETCAAELSANGTVPGDVVAVSASQGIAGYVSLVGISLLDATVLPLSDDGLAELARAGRVGARRWLSQDGVDRWLESRGAMLVHPIADVKSPSTERSDIVYLLATSGTTSTPKTVPISETNVEAYARHLTLAYGHLDREVIAQNFRLHFDAYIEVLLLAWVTRSQVVYPRGREHMLVSRFVGEYGITVWDCVPSHVRLAARMRQLCPPAYDGIKLSIFGGESLTTDVLIAWRQAAPRSVLVNSYGPTEMTIACTEFVMGPDEPIVAADGRVPIGWSLPSVEAALVKAESVSGRLRELCVRGPQRFDGYLEPFDVAATFYADVGGEVGVPLRSDTVPTDAWYRTGDMVEMTESGIVYHGRRDSQVKLQGQRIDLAAVEAHFVINTEVRAAWVGVSQEQIVAVLEADEPVDAADLHLGELRPYARPSRILWLPELPLLPNGKTDQQQLRVLIDRDRPASADDAPLLAGH